MNYAEELRNDHLLGIAKQLPQALIINRVQNCLKSYSSINLEKLTKYAQVSTITETENILVSHFDNIRIDKENNIVYVVTDSTRLPISTSTLSNSLKLLRSTYDQVENLRQKLITSPKYIQQSSGEFHI
jgi:transcriptional regulator of heat shock response